MRIEKVEERDGLHFVRINHNDMVAEYCLEHSLCNPDQFKNELISFSKTFFDLGEEDWQGVMSKEAIRDTFLDYYFIKEVV